MAIFAVTTAKAANWDHARGIREQDAWDEHALFADGLVERGVIVLGGPISSEDDEDVGLMAVDAESEHELRSIFDDDPWVTGGVLRIKHVRSWSLWLDGRGS